MSYYEYLTVLSTDMLLEHWENKSGVFFWAQCI